MLPFAAGPSTFSDPSWYQEAVLPWPLCLKAHQDPQTCWGCGDCSPLPGAVLGGDRGCMCLQGAGRRGGAGPQGTSQSQLAESLQQGLHTAAGGEDPLAPATTLGWEHGPFPHLGSFQEHPQMWGYQQWCPQSHSHLVGRPGGAGSAEDPLCVLHAYAGASPPPSPLC